MNHSKLLVSKRVEKVISAELDCGYACSAKLVPSNNASRLAAFRAVRCPNSPPRTSTVVRGIAERVDSAVQVVISVDTAYTPKNSLMRDYIQKLAVAISGATRKRRQSTGRCRRTGRRAHVCGSCSIMRFSPAALKEFNRTLRDVAGEE
jgi:uncharacterized protein (DUF3084 family)